MTSPTDGWATGNDASGAGIFLHYTDGTWAQAAAIPDTTFDTVSMTSPDEGWASGTRGERGTTLYHYSRGAWAPIDLPEPNHLRFIQGISALGPGNMWALGIETAGWRDRGILLHYQVGKWSSVAIPKSPPESAGQFIDVYGPMGFLFFALVGLMWAWGKSFRAPPGSDWSHWLTRVILADGVFLVAGYLIVTALPLFADDLPVDPSRIATVTEFGLIFPAMALQVFTQPAAWIVSARRKMRSQRPQAPPPLNAREMEIHHAGKRND
jgi:hypothetical protein